MGASSASHKEKEEGSSPCAQTFSACGGAAIAAYKVYMEYEILRSSPFDYLTAAATPLRAIVKDCSRKKEKKINPRSFHDAVVFQTPLRSHEADCESSRTRELSGVIVRPMGIGV